MNHEYERINNLAQRLCSDAGRDWNAKGCKRNGWRVKARALIEKNDWEWNTNAGFWSVFGPFLRGLSK